MRTRFAVLLLLTAGCASAPIRQADLPRLAEADARVLEGCYDCLIEARDTYERLATGRARPVLAPRLFEVHVLIGLREAELARSPDESFSRAEALLPALPPEADGALHLEIARAILPDSVGTPRAELRARLERARPLIAREADLRARLAAAQVSPVFRDYLAAGLTCLVAAEGASPAGRRRTDIPADAPPLLEYRMASCPMLRPELQDEVLAAVPGFIEAGLQRARRPTLLFTAAYVRDLRRWLTTAYERFPDSPSVTYALGAMYQTVADCRAAVEYYEETLALAPGHEYAAMQRVVCLGYLAQHQAAIDSATEIIDRRYEDMAADAYYWRAWNRHRLKQLVEARADAARSIAIDATARAYALAGFINYDMKEMDLAEVNLKAALSADRSQCLAAWHLGLVQFARESWAAMADAFTGSAACYQREADANEVRLESVRSGDLDPDYKAIQIANFEIVIRDDRGQEEASYLNAANGYTRIGDFDRAIAALARIPDHSPHADGARELRAFVATLTTPETDNEPK